MSDKCISHKITSFFTIKGTLEQNGAVGEKIEVLTKKKNENMKEETLEKKEKETIGN